MNKNEKFGIIFLILSNLLLFFSIQVYLLSATVYGNPVDHQSMWIRSLVGLNPAFFGWGVLIFFFGVYMLFSKRKWRGGKGE